MAELFVSYRVEDEPYAAALIDSALGQRFGADKVFRDTRSIRPGEDYVHGILDTLRGCSTLLAVVGSRWLGAVGASGLPRIRERHDWVRREISEAFDRGLRVIPILVAGARPPDAAELPADLIRLTRCQYLRLDHRSDVYDIDRLCSELTTLVPGLASGASGSPTVSVAPKVARRRRAVADWAAPRELPPAVPAFTGRVDELAELDEALAAADGRPPAVVISAVAGAAGVGKTALAIRWAHQVCDRFPDGQLYVDLRGYDPDLPLDPAEALDGFLRSLGVAGAEIPTRMAERVGRYRTLLAGRRVLVVLDNAYGTDQVRDLLPGTPSCFVIVTSRDKLPGLVARHGAQRLDLEALPSGEAVALLARLIGGRVDDEPVEAAALAECCARLPLALRLVAELAVSRAATSLADLLAELADQRRLLDLLDASSEPRTAVRAVFSWSYRHLPHDVARLFRLLGLHPGRNIDAYSVAALANTTYVEALHLLQTLLRAHLVEPSDSDRFGIHDLLRAYAFELVMTGDPEAVRQEALRRLLEHQLHTASVAMDLYAPQEQHLRPRTRSPRTPAPPLTDPAAATAWLDAERPNLIAGALSAADHGIHLHTVEMSTILWFYLDISAHYYDAETLHTSASRTDDPVGKARALNGLGSLYNRLGRYDEAFESARLALDVARKISNISLQAKAVGNLGVTHVQRGDYERANEHLQQSLDLYRKDGDPSGEASTLTNLGVLYERMGRYPQALAYHRQARPLHLKTGNRLGETFALTNIATVFNRLGRYEQAIDHLQQALAIRRKIGHPYGEAYALTHLGAALARIGRHEQAMEHLQLAVTIAHEIGNREFESEALSGIGAVYERLERPEEALTYHQQALNIARATGEYPVEAKALNGVGRALHLKDMTPQALAAHQHALALAKHIGDRYEQARAHEGIARAASESTEARNHWDHALALYTELGVPEEGSLRNQRPADSGATVLRETRNMARNELAEP